VKRRFGCQGKERKGEETHEWHILNPGGLVNHQPADAAIFGLQAVFPVRHGPADLLTGSQNLPKSGINSTLARVSGGDPSQGLLVLNDEIVQQLEELLPLAKGGLGPSLLGSTGPIEDRLSRHTTRGPEERRLTSEPRP